MDTVVAFNQEYTKYKLQYAYLKEESANQIEMFNHLVTVVGPNIETDYRVAVGLREYRVMELTMEMRRWQRRMTLRQEALNRGEKPDYVAIERRLDEEWSRLAGVWSKDDRRKLCLYLAIQGVGGACRDIAFDYDREIRGRDCEKNPKYDFKRMLYWFERGAESGDAQSQYNAGYLYRNAEKTQHDCDRAVYWFEKAAAQDHVGGLKALAYCLECGRCVPTDRKRVEELKKRAAELEKEGKTE